MEKKEKNKKLKKEFFKKFLHMYIYKKLSNRNRIVFDKSTSIFNVFSGQIFLIHNGNVFRRVSVNFFLSCLKFGNFVFTRKPFKYLIKKKKR